MKKTIIKSTIYLILISILAKALSFMVRILLARSLSSDAMNLYSLAAPTMVFVITLAQMGIPNALSKVIASSNQSLGPVKTSVWISVVNNLVVSVLFVCLIPYLASSILKQQEILPVLYAILPLIPMVTVSGILKGYLYGIQHHLTATSCQIFEELSRIIFLLVVFRLLPNVDAAHMAEIAMFSVTIGEMCSVLFMGLTLLHKKKRTYHVSGLFHDLQRKSFDEVLSISIPMTGSRLIGSLTYFLEPIVMVLGLSVLESSTMVNAYGQLNGYVLPIITMPSFITVTLSNFLLPSFTYHYTRGNQKAAGKLFNVIIGCCFFIGLACSFVCYTFNEELMMLFYHTTNGADLLKTLAWPFAFYALQPPLSSMLHALSRSKRTMVDTFSGSLLRLLCVAFLTPIEQTHALAIGLTLGMIVTTLFHAVNVIFAMQKA